jgi:hypothetical protein
MANTLPKHKNALPRATNSKHEQPIDIDPNTILRNSLITTNYYFVPNKQKMRKGGSDFDPFETMILAEIRRLLYVRYLVSGVSIYSTVAISLLMVLD